MSNQVKITQFSKWKDSAGRIFICIDMSASWKDGKWEINTVTLYEYHKEQAVYRPYAEVNKLIASNKLIRI